MTAVDEWLHAAGEDTRTAIRDLAIPVLRPARRRLRPGLALAITAAVIVVVAATAWPNRSDTAIDVGAERGGSEQPPPIVVGETGPEPRFDPAPLGTEVPLVADDDLDGLVDDVVARITGDVVGILSVGRAPSGRPAAVVHSIETDAELGTDLWMRCQWLDGPTSCTSDDVAGLEWPPQQPSAGLADPDLSYTSGGPGELVWSNVPAGTAVVTYATADDTWWQRPVGGAVVLPTDLEAGDRFVLEALGTDGESLDTVRIRVPRGGRAAAPVPGRQDWEMTLRVDDGRVARLFVAGDGLCVQIDGDQPSCESEIGHPVGWFVVPVPDTDRELIALQYLYDAPVVTSDSGDDIGFEAQFGPGALHRALVEVPAAPGYSIEIPERDVLVADEFDGGAIERAELFAVPDGRLCIEVRSPVTSSIDCARLEDDATSLTAHRAELAGWPVLYGTAPPDTATIKIEDTHHRATSAKLDSVGGRAYWISDSAIASFDSQITIGAIELIDDGYGDPRARTLATIEHDLEAAPGATIELPATSSGS